MEVSSGLIWQSFCHSALKVFLKHQFGGIMLFLLCQPSKTFWKALKHIIVTKLFFKINLAFILENVRLLRLFPHYSERVIFPMTIQPICDFYHLTIFKNWYHAKKVSKFSLHQSFSISVAFLSALGQKLG